MPRTPPSRSRWSPAIPTATALTYSATGLPAGLTIDPATGLISGTLSYASAGTHAVTVTVSDVRATDQHELHVDGDQCESRAGADRRGGSDRCGKCGDLAAARGERSGRRQRDLQRDGLAAGLTIDPTTGVISGTLAYASAGTHPVTVTVTDGGADDREPDLHLDGDERQSRAGR